MAPDELRVDAERLQLGDDVVAERIGADLRQHGAAMPEPGCRDGDVGRRSADRLDEALVVEPAGAGSVGVEVDADPADRQQVERHRPDAGALSGLCQLE